LHRLGRAGTSVRVARVASPRRRARGEARTRARGFTLLETVVALGVATLIAGIGVVQLAGLLATARVAGAARTVATALRLARGVALSSDATTEVRFDTTRGVCETRDAGGVVLTTHALPPGVVFASLPVRSRVLFGGLGTADNATIVVAGAGRLRRVIVNQRGRVRVQ